MGLIINRAQTQSGRAAPGFNYYSGMMFYGTAPAGWKTYTHPLYPSVTISAQQILSTPAAIAAGITPFTDNVANTWTSLCTIGTIGNIITISALVPVVGGGTSTVYLCNAFVLTGSTLALQGAAIAAAINANTFSTGFSATFATATLTLIAPASVGIAFNVTSPYTLSATGTAPFVFGVPSVVVSGTASTYADAYYQISEYYRTNATGNLWIGFISASSSFQELLALQLASGNLLRQIGICDTNTGRGAVGALIATSQSIQAIATQLSQNHPFEVIYRPNIAALTSTTLSTLPNGQTNTNTNNVQVCITQDGLAQGNLLFQVNGYSISNIGANLGVLSASRISSSIAQPIQSNNVSNGIENNTPAISNGTLNSAISVSLFQQLFGTGTTAGYRYVGFATFPGNVSGTFFTNNPMFISSTSRYAYMNDNRVWDAVTRILQQCYIPYLNSEVLFNNDGTINNSSIVFLQNIGVAAITAGMITGINPPYISGAPTVTISPNQPLQQTNNLVVSVTTEENGIARQITISNGFSN